MSDDTEDIGRAIRATAATVEAPPSLRGALDSRPAPRRANSILGFIATACAIAAVVLMFGAGGPTVEQVAGAALHEPTQPAGDAPDYGDWKPVGAREDKVDGREARTVIYRKGALGAHYTIVDGDPLDLPDGEAFKARGIEFVKQQTGNVRLVAWEAKGKTCILSSTMADLDDLVKFASYGR